MDCCDHVVVVGKRLSARFRIGRGDREQQSSDRRRRVDWAGIRISDVLTVRPRRFSKRPLNPSLHAGGAESRLTNHGGSEMSEADPLVGVWQVSGGTWTISGSPGGYNVIEASPIFGQTGAGIARL